MGERGNIKVGGVYLYTHWEGYMIKNILQNALKRKQRWNDEPYLTRIIFSEMVKDDVDGETGLGISTEICDNEYPILEVDCDNQKVIEQEKEWSFEEFIKQEFKE